MLDERAPNHVWKDKEHHFWVSYNGRTFKNLPKGEHGGKGEIERGWVTKMARFLRISECAERLMPGFSN